MSPQKSPAFSFYARDFLAGTSTMSLQEVGAYVRLLAYQWDAGGIPEEAEERARVMGCAKSQERELWKRVGKKFVLRDGVYLNERLEEERTKQTERRQRLSDNGSKGADAKWKRQQNVVQARAIGTHTEDEWLEMLQVYEFKCLKCGCTPVGRPCKDHVIPISDGGSDSITNLQPLCRECNTSKKTSRTDYRLGHPKTLARWLAGPLTGPQQEDGLAFASSSSGKDHNTHSARANGHGNGANAPNSLPRDHRFHAICGPKMRVCLTERTAAELASKWGGVPDDAMPFVREFCDYLETLIGEGSKGDHLWLLQHFEGFMEVKGRAPAAPPAKSKANGVTAAIDAWGRE